MRAPANRVRFAWALLAVCFAGWPATHAAMLITKPPDASSWVFHLLLGLSWLSPVLTALNIIATTDVRREQDEGDS